MGDESGAGAAGAAARIDALIAAWADDGTYEPAGRARTRAELLNLAEPARASGTATSPTEIVAEIFDAIDGDDQLTLLVGDGPVEGRPRTHWRWLAVAALVRARETVLRDGNDASVTRGPYRAAGARDDDDPVCAKLDANGVATRVRDALEKEEAATGEDRGRAARADRLEDLRRGLEEMALVASPHAALASAMFELEASVAVMRAIVWVDDDSLVHRPWALDALTRIESIFGKLVGVTISRDELIARVVPRLEHADGIAQDRVADDLAATLSVTPFLDVHQSLTRLSVVADEAQTATAAAAAELRWTDRINFLWDGATKARWRSARNAAVAAEDAHREAVDEMYSLFARALEELPGPMLQLRLPSVRRAIEAVRPQDDGGLDGHARLVEISTEWCAEARELLGPLPSAADVLLRYVVSRLAPSHDRAR